MSMDQLIALERVVERVKKLAGNRYKEDQYNEARTHLDDLVVEIAQTIKPQTERLK